MKNFWFLLLLAGGILVACNKEDDHGDDGHYDATITIVSPAEGGTATVDEALAVQVDFTRPDSKIIHNVKVEVLDANDAVLKTLIETHAHQEGSYTFQSSEFIPTAHGAYKLRATTTNDAGEEPVTATANFTAMHASSGEYKVTIDIISPAADATVALNQAMAVEVNYTNQTHGAIIHHIMIDIIDSNGTVVKTVFQGHVHTDMPYNYKDIAAWTPDKAGDYTLRAMTTDDEMGQMNMMTRTFKVQ